MEVEPGKPVIEVFGERGLVMVDDIHFTSLNLFSMCYPLAHLSTSISASHSMSLSEVYGCSKIFYGSARNEYFFKAV